MLKTKRVAKDWIAADKGLIRRKEAITQRTIASTSKTVPMWFKVFTYFSFRINDRAARKS
jgi:hypothetical protein